jgi:hypothetical protein
MTNNLREQLIEALQLSHRQLSDLLMSVAADQDWQPAPEQWSFRYIAAHLATVEKECFQDRLRRLAAGGKPHFEYYLNTGRDFGRFELTDSLRNWAVTRQENIDFVRDLAEEQWTLTGLHQTFGPMTVLDALKVMVDHDQEHWQELVQLLAEYNSGTR